MIKLISITDPSRLSVLLVYPTKKKNSVASSSTNEYISCSVLTETFEGV